MTTYSSITGLDITLTTLGNQSGQKAGNVDNSTDLYQKIHWYTRIKSDSVAPSGGYISTIYGYRNDTANPDYVTDGQTTGNTPLSGKPENALPIGSIVVTATANKFFYSEGIWRNPGPGQWSIGLYNAIGQALSTGINDNFIHWVGEKA